MIINLIGARGTVPTAKSATVSFLVDNQFLFECPSEIIQSLKRNQKEWKYISENYELDSEINALGKPSFSKIRYIILSHLHHDHWGGLAHFIHRILLLEKERRIKNPLNIIIPKFSTLSFQERMKEQFETVIDPFPLDDAEFLLRFLCIEIGSGIKSIIKIRVIENNERIQLDRNYSLIAKENSHLNSGSVSYKLEFKLTKLKVETAKELKIPFNSLLNKILKSKEPVLVDGRKISRDQIFYDLSTILGYSGDTDINSGVINFFQNCDIIIHDATYLHPQDDYHLDLHSDLITLLEKVINHSNLKLIVPIHFSIRYNDLEISKQLEELKQNYKSTFNIVNPLTTFLIMLKPPDNVSIVKKTD